MANYDLDFGGVKYQAKPLSSGSGYQLFSNNAPTTNYVMNDGSVMSGGKNIGSANLSGNNISFTDTSGQTATGTYGSTTMPTANNYVNPNQGQSYDSWIGNQGNAFQSPSDFYSWMAQGQNPSYVNQLINQNNIDPNSVIDAYNAGSGAPAISYDTGNNWLGNNQNTNPVTMPDNSNANVPSWIDSLFGNISNFDTAYNNFANLPGQIDNWTNESLKQQRVTSDNVSSLLDALGEQQAGSGIMGGTESQAMKAKYLSDMTNTINTNKMNIMNNANTLKSQAISALPGQAMNPINTAVSLYGSNAADQQNWASLAAQMINASY